MRFRVTLLLAAVLVLGPIPLAGARTEAAQPDAPPTEAVASEAETGRLRFVHAAEGAPRMGIDLSAPGGGLIGMWVVEPGTTTDLEPDVPLVPGTYSMTILPPTGGATSGEGEITTFDVPVAAGYTTVVTAYADQHGRLLFVMDTPEGEITHQPLFAGTLIVEHDVDGGPTVDVVVWVLEQERRAVEMGRLVPGGTVDDELEAGPHTLLLYAAGDVVGRTGFFVVDDETTVIRVSEVLEPGHGASAPARSEAPTTATEAGSPSTFPRPERIDTGRGGGTNWRPILLGAFGMLVVGGAAGFAVAHRMRATGRPGA